MPLSIWNGMEDCLDEIVAGRPTSILDAGIGFGLWGCLLRQYLDVWFGRIQPNQWRTRIDGIEIDPTRVQAHARYLYDEVVIGDVRTLVPQRAHHIRYDVILFGDVIEHLPKDDGWKLLEVATDLAAQRVVVRIPFGNGWRREGRSEPDHHRSQWYPADFDEHPIDTATARVRQYNYHGNPYGLVSFATRAKRGGGNDLARLAELSHRLEQIERRIKEVTDHGTQPPHHLDH